MRAPILGLPVVDQVTTNYQVWRTHHPRESDRRMLDCAKTVAATEEDDSASFSERIDEDVVASTDMGVAAELPGQVAVANITSPAVAADIVDPAAAVNSLSLEEVESELAVLGIVPPAGTNDEQMRRMLVELRSMGVSTPQPLEESWSFDNEFERALWERPLFKALVDGYHRCRETSYVNLAMEFTLAPAQTRERYIGSGYEATIREIEAALGNAWLEAACVPDVEVLDPPMGAAGVTRGALVETEPRSAAVPRLRRLRYSVPLACAGMALLYLPLAGSHGGLALRARSSLCRVGLALRLLLALIELQLATAVCAVSGSLLAVLKAIGA